MWQYLWAGNPVVGDQYNILAIREPVMADGGAEALCGMMISEDQNCRSTEVQKAAFARYDWR
jgi:hypothetical protein